MSDVCHICNKPKATDEDNDRACFERGSCSHCDALCWSDFHLGHTFEDERKAVVSLLQEVLRDLETTGGGSLLCNKVRKALYALNDHELPPHTGWAASWCPICGRCRCSYDVELGIAIGDNASCPLHGEGSPHPGDVHEH